MRLLLVSPRMSASAGHDKVMALAEGALPDTVPWSSTRLARDGGRLRARGAWAIVEGGKRTLARLDAIRSPRTKPAREPRRIGAWMEAASVRARGSGGLSHLLTEAYRAELEDRAARGEEARVVSSHYLGLAGRPAGWPATLVGPDLLAQPATASVEGARVVLSPGPSYTKSLMQVGFRAGEILCSGPVVSPRLYRTRHRREEARLRVARGEQVPRALLALGGSAPERAQAVQIARRLSDRGVEVVVIVGDDRPHARQIRALLLGLPGIRIIGGTAGFDREAELATFAQQLEDPNLVGWITRPNEGAPLALALGFELWLLAPYQPHEREAWGLLSEAGVPDATELLGPARIGMRPRTPRRASELVYDPKQQDRAELLAQALS